MSLFKNNFNQRKKLMFLVIIFSFQGSPSITSEEVSVRKEFDDSVRFITCVDIQEERLSEERHRSNVIKLKCSQGSASETSTTYHTQENRETDALKEDKPPSDLVKEERTKDCNNIMNNNRHIRTDANNNTEDANKGSIFTEGVKEYEEEELFSKCLNDEPRKAKPAKGLFWNCFSCLNNKSIKY